LDREGHSGGLVLSILRHVHGSIQVSQSGPDVINSKVFSPKKSAKKLAFVTQNKDKLCKNLIITLL
jgi:hypothetical protein